MSYNSVLLAQRHVNSHAVPPVWETLCPTLRIPIVTNLTTHTAVPGGYLEASFTIPAARVRLEAAQYGSAQKPRVCWIYEGLSVIFFGLLNKCVPQPNGDVQCFVDGMYKRLDATRMREIWGDSDLTKLTPAPDNASAGSMNVDGNGDLTFSFPKGAAPSNGSNLYSSGDFVAADYYAFGEPLGTRDKKRLTGWDVTIGSTGKTDFTGTAYEVRIYGMDTPGDSSPVLLQTFQQPDSRIETADSTHGGENTVNWPNLNGYRLFRIGLWVATGIDHITQDTKVKIKNFNVSTRAIAPSAITLTTSPTTTKIVRDIWRGAGQGGKDLSDYLEEDNASAVGGMITGNIADSNQVADSINFTTWTAPREIIEAMADLDGFKVGMYEPTLNVPQNAFVILSLTTIQYWYRQPPELAYEAWPNINDPDYHIRFGRGAEWEPDPEADQLLQGVYVNYTSRAGRSQSVYTGDDDTENRMYEQGQYTAIDWQIDPSVSANTATTLGNQYLEGFEQPALTGVITVRGDRPGSIEMPGGARFYSLSSVKPGVIRVVDAKGAKGGRVTDIVYTAKSSNGPETLVMTVNSPISARLNRNLARLSHRADVTRNR